MGDSQRSRSPDEDDVDDQSQVEDTDGRKQANRACDFCHRMKMKCIGKENPPCRRCKSGGHDCTFNGPRKSKSTRVEDRLKFVESQMGSMQGALQELLQLQRAALPQPTPQSSHANHVPPAPHQMPGSGSQQTYSSDGFSQAPQSMLSMQTLFNPAQNPSGPSAVPQTPSSLSWQHFQVPAIPAASASRGPSKPASVPSDDEDEVDPMTSNTHRDWDNMFYLAEAARLEQDGNLGPGEKEAEPSLLPPGTSKRRMTNSSDASGTRKRKRGIAADDDFSEVKRNLPLQRGEFVRHFQDPIELGFCDEATARESYRSFMDNCLIYMPCFDPEIDTFDSLRKRSPFCITTFVMVEAKVKEIGGPVTELHRQCREHAERIGMSTLFSPVARIGAVQAMIVLSSWGDTTWRPGGHALRMAMDMGLYRCLPLLVQGGMGRGKTSAELQEEYPLVVGTRVWLTLYKMEHEMAFNLGRPALFAGEETIRNCREFLRHPLSVLTDSRLVATCELLSARASLHQPFALIPNASSIPDLDHKLNRLDKIIRSWADHWDSHYAARGMEPGHFLRESLKSYVCSAELFANSRILHGIRNKHDIAKLPEHRRQRLITARKAAERHIGICLRGNEYTHKFAYANLYTHLAIAFSARCLVRLVSLIPDGANVRQIGRDVDKVAQVLTKVPGFQYGAYLREVLGRARRHKVLPPASRPASPGSRHAPIAPMSMSSLIADTPTPGVLVTDAGSGSQSFTFDVSPTNDANPFDFSYAEQLFSLPQTDATQSYLENNLSQSNTGFNIESWFPFPPLEGDNGQNDSTNHAADNSFAAIFGDGTNNQSWW